MNNDNPGKPNPERVLSIPVKKSDAVELYRPLRNFVCGRYSESDAVKVESVLESMSKCRMDMVERGDLSLPRQRDCLLHYLKCLCMVEPLFTAISSDSDYDSEPIMFVWYDAFCEHGVSSQRNSIQLEKAAVLFNLGAVCSQIGASCDLTTALGRHLAIDAFNASAGFFLKLWKDYAKDVSATLDLTLLFAEILQCLFSAQASELKLQQHNATVSFKSVSKLYESAYDLLLRDSAATAYVLKFDRTWVTHLYQKVEFFKAEARRRGSLLKSKRPDTSELVQQCPLEKLFTWICRRPDQWIPKQQPIYLDFLLSEYNPFKIVDGKLIANPWSMLPPYPKKFAILSSSSSSNIFAIPLKKSEDLDLYEPLRNYFVLKYSEIMAKRVEGLLEMLNRLRSEMQRDDLSLPIRRDSLIRYLKCLHMIEPFFPMTTSPNPPVFVWYDAFNPQESSSQHSIHLEKASVLFNLGALCTHIAASCDLTTIQGYRVAIDALHDASHWFAKLPLVAARASATTIDLSVSYAKLLCEVISAQVTDLKWNYPHSHSDSDGSSLPIYPVPLLYQKAYDLLTSGPLAENVVQSSIHQYLESKMKTCHVNTASIDVIGEFLLGYCQVISLLPEGCQPRCLDLLSEAGPVMIKDGNLVANLRGSDIVVGGDELHADQTTQ
ncbi:hypothetical protein PIB30_022225 [Stylosanthes scabra]|uniref:BRO1 domain-containing protein n=1 Tax=Stylosanthes scabra TaxID=79078 RepID=A0ABU6Z8J9_9FABA|nr:hypothetical protein [Stylosanthes scabra]